MENPNSPKSGELTGELLVRCDGFSDKWKTYIITLTSASIYKAKPGKTDVKEGSSLGERKKKFLTDLQWTSSCAEVAPTEYVAYRNDQPRPKIKRDFCFRVSSMIDFSQYGHHIHTSRSTIYFAAKDQQERSKWIQAITNNIENYKKTSQCIEKHNNLVKEKQNKFGATWSVLTAIEGSGRATSDPAQTTPVDLNSTISAALNFNRAVYNMGASEPAQDSGMTKKELEMKVMEQDMEISRLKARLEALERTVTELAKSIPKQ